MTVSVGLRIKNLREERGLSQTELAEKIGVSKQNLYKYETGIISNIPSDKIEAIARTFEVSPAVIMGWEESTEDAELQEYLEELKNRSELRMLFKLAKNATKEDVEQAVRIIEAIAKKDE